MRGLPRAWWVPVSIALGFATWPFLSVRASPGLDHSWQLALHLAASHGLDYGHDLVFTYGPLGFLLQPVLVGGVTGTASVLVTFAAQVAFCALLLRGALRSVSPPLAILITYAIAGVLATVGFSLIVPDYLAFFVLFLAVWMLERETPAPAAFVVLGAIAAAVQLFVKLNGGILCILVLALSVWRCRPGGIRSLALLAVSYVGSAMALWLLTGNDLSDLPTWIRLAGHVVTAYSGSMGLEASGYSLQYPEAAVAVLLAGAAVTMRVRRLGRARALSLGALLLVYGFGYWKEGFVRHDVHGLAFFAAVAIALLAFRWEGLGRIAAAVALVAVVAVSVTAPEFSGTGHVPFHPVRSTVAAGRALADSVVPHRRNRAIAAGRASIRDRLTIDGSVLAELRGRTVDVGPYETSAAWAYGLDWRPELLVQQYVAGDAELDTANADALASRGPARILRQESWPALDGKHPLYEAPSTFMVLVCRYRELSANVGWAVFGRGPNRCGPARLLRSTAAAGSVTVPVPTAPNPRDVVFARIHVHVSARERLAALLLKPRHLPTIIVGQEQYPLVPATATGPLVLRMPAAAGMSASEGGAVDYPRVGVADAPSYRIDFYAVALTSPWRGPARLPGALTARTVSIGTKRARLVPGALDGHLEHVSTSGGAAIVTGWAANLADGVPADRIAVFAHGRLLGWAHPTLTRFDVVALGKNPALLYSGFSVIVAASDLRGSGGTGPGALKVVALLRGRASILADRRP